MRGAKYEYISCHKFPRYLFTIEKNVMNKG